MMENGSAPAEESTPSTVNAPVASKAELWGHLMAVWENFRQQVVESDLVVPSTVREHVRIDPCLLVESIENARIDLERMVRWHLADDDQGEEARSETAKLPDSHKYAAFMAKWVAKIRPVQVGTDTGFLKPLHTINALFALWVFQSFLKVRVPSELVDHLVYMFHFRDEKGETLAVVAFLCERIAELEAELARVAGVPEREEQIAQLLG